MVCLMVGIGMVSSMHFIYLCSIDNTFFVKVKDINSVNTYSGGPSLRYEAYHLILVPSLILIFRQ